MIAILKTRSQLTKLRESNRIVAEFLAVVKEVTKPGITTLELNNIAEEISYNHDAVPGFKGYKKYPFAICASVNEQVVHGLPNDIPLKEGCILGVDFGILKDGFYGDAAITVPVGEITDEAQRLIEVTSECLDKGIEKAVVGNKLSDISHAIQITAEGAGFSVVKEYVGHSIGKELHESPQIPNYGAPGKGIALKPGMVLSIEPMVVVGNAKTTRASDGWTVFTVDRSLSAHFEHTIEVTETEPGILTIN